MGWPAGDARGALGSLSVFQFGYLDDDSKIRAVGELESTAFAEMLADGGWKMNLWSSSK
jgi:hypothetical protein